MSYTLKCLVDKKAKENWPQIVMYATFRHGGPMATYKHAVLFA